MKQHSLVINTLSRLSKFTGIAKHTDEISRKIPLLDRSFDPAFYSGCFRGELSAKEHLLVFHEAR